MSTAASNGGITAREFMEKLFGDASPGPAGVDALEAALKATPADQGRYVGVPGELKALPQWVLWRHDPDAGKVPCQADGSNAKTNDPQTWATFEAALAAYRANPRKFAGVGFCFADGGGYTGVDLDGCLVNGEVAEWARPWLEKFKGGYSEISPSGKGVKIWCRGEFGGSGGKRNLDGQAHTGVEIYCKGRFFAVTGDVLESPAGAIPKLQAAVNETRAWVKTKPEKPEEPAASNGRATNGQADDRKAKAPVNGRPDAATRARACIMSDKHPDAVSGQRGHDVIYSAACALVDGFGLDRTTAHPILWDFNLAKAIPPESEYQIDHKLDDAIKNHPTPSLRLLNANGTYANGQASRSTTIEPEPDLDDIEIEDRWPVPDPEMFYGVAGEVARLADPHSEGDMVATLVQFLIAVGSMLGRRIFYPITATRHYNNLFAVMVGPTSSGRKGTGLDVVLWVLSLIDEAWRNSHVKTGLVSGEGLIYHVRDPKYRPPTREEIKKGLAQPDDQILDDPGVTDKRLLVTETEFSRTIKAAGRDSNTLSEVLRQLWETGKGSTLGKKEPVFATDAHVSIIAHATKADVRRYLSETDSLNGFANRFLWCLTRRSKLLPEGGDLQSVDWTEVIRQVNDVRAFVGPVGSGPDVQMARDATARRLWADIYGDLSIEKNGLVGSICGRAAPQVVRLSCLYAILDHSRMIRPEHIVAAVALWNFCEASAKLIFEGGGGDPNEEKLLEALRAAPGGLSRTEINRVFSGNLKAKLLARLLEDVLTRGLVHRKKTPQPSGAGRPSERWFYGRA